jgi:very-short-patch-repair endonuclease
MHLYNNKRLKNTRRLLRKNQTSAEKKIWHYLRKRQIENHRFLRQYSLGKYILDFYCPAKKIAIEIDGGQHFKKKKKYDQTRTEFLKTKRIRELRFWNKDVLKNTQGVLFEIRKSLRVDNENNSPIKKD